jgi:hypothetical protein
LTTSGGTAPFTYTIGGGTSPYLVNSVRFGSNNAQAIAFTNGSDLLNIESGGILSDGNNQTRTIGTTAIPGILTAGGATPGALAELFFHNNSNTMTVNSSIVDNGATPVKVRQGPQRHREPDERQHLLRRHRRPPRRAHT